MAFSQIAMKTMAAAAGIAAAGIVTATPAYADPETLQFGQTAEVPSPGGAIDYTVSNLQPSGHNDGIWYADVTAAAVSGLDPEHFRFQRSGCQQLHLRGHEGQPDGRSCQPTDRTGVSNHRAGLL